VHCHLASGSVVGLLSRRRAWIANLLINKSKLGPALKELISETGRWFMPLVQLVVVLIVVGVLLGMVNRYIPMAGSIKSILNGVVVIGVVLWLLNVFGLFPSLSAIHVGKLTWLGANGA